MIEHFDALARAERLAVERNQLGLADALARASIYFRKIERFADEIVQDSAAETLTMERARIIRINPPALVLVHGGRT